MNKKQITLLNNYKRATTTNLSELYKNASGNKWHAYFNILEKAKAQNGYNVKVFNANSMQYSMAFLSDENGKQYLNYFTAYNYYKILID